MCLKDAKLINFRKFVLSNCVIRNRYHGYSVPLTLFLLCLNLFLLNLALKSPW
jgi:hypothetical protein